MPLIVKRGDLFVLIPVTSSRATGKNDLTELCQIYCRPLAGKSRWAAGGFASSSAASFIRLLLTLKVQFGPISSAVYRARTFPHSTSDEMKMKRARAREI